MTPGVHSPLLTISALKVHLLPQSPPSRTRTTVFIQLMFSKKPSNLNQHADCIVN